MAKIVITNAIKSEIKEILAKKALEKTFRNLDKKIVEFSDKVYDRIISKDLEKNLSDLGLTQDWIKYGDIIKVKINRKISSQEKFGFTYYLDFLDGTFSYDSLRPFSYYESYEFRLHLSQYKPLPFNNETNIFVLTDEEIKEYENIIKDYIKKTDKIRSTVLDSINVVNSFKYFEDLFEYWKGSEKLLAKIYQSRKDELAEKNVKHLPSVNFDEINSTLELEQE